MDSPTIYSLRDLTSISSGQAKQDEVFVALPAYHQSGIDYVLKGGGVKAKLDISLMVDGLALRIRFTADYDGPCSRCLEPAVFHADIDAYQVHHPNEQDEDLRSEHVNDLEQEIDLTAWAAEEVGLQFPTKVLCKVDCPGLDTSYGDPPSEDEVDLHGELIDPRWAALKKIQEPDN